MPPPPAPPPLAPAAANSIKAERTVQLGFSEPLVGREERGTGNTTEEELDWVGHRSAHYDDWDGGQIGGTPSWLNPQYVPSAVMCRLCHGPMTFVLQLYAPIDALPPTTCASTTPDEDCGNDDDGIGGEDRAFHRTLYVFACRKCCGSLPGDDASDHCAGCVRVLRSQLPRANPYYPDEVGHDDDINNWDRHRPEAWKVNVCAVCGVRATKRCPQQDRYFCGPDHQREYKRHVRDKDKNPTHGNPPREGALGLSHELPSLLPLSELVVEEEPPPASTSAAEASGDGVGRHDRPLFPSRRRSGSSDSDPDSDEDLEQEDLNNMVLGTNGERHKTTSRDAITEAFYDRIQRGGVQTQCLRYCRWITSKSNDSVGSDDDHANVLWLHSQHRAVQVPPCAMCGAHRRFEFQLMPQLLHYLQKRGSMGDDGPEGATSVSTDVEGVKSAMEQADSWIQQTPPELVPPALAEAKANATKEIQRRLYSTLLSLDWGVVAVYTCPNSCVAVGADPNLLHPELGACVEEFAWRQPPLDDS